MKASELRIQKRAHLCVQFVQKVTRLRRCLRHALIQNVLRVSALAQKLRSLYQTLVINKIKSSKRKLDKRIEDEVHLLAKLHKLLKMSEFTSRQRELNARSTAARVDRTRQKRITGK